MAAYSRQPKGTPAFCARSATMRLAMLPTSSRLPAKVLAGASSVPGYDSTTPCARSAASC
jgi:hypothetical protein